MIIVQQIHVRWSKKSRGAPGSDRRNAVPKSLLIDLEECPFLYEKYVFNEMDSFIQTREVHMVKDLIPDQVGNILLKYQSEELVVRFLWDWDVGIPKRYDKRSVLHLSTETLGRLVVNGYQGYYYRGINWYTQDIYNFAVVNQPTPELFISRDPEKICDLRVKLF